MTGVSALPGRRRRRSNDDLAASDSNQMTGVVVAASPSRVPAVSLLNETDLTQSSSSTYSTMTDPLSSPHPATDALPSGIIFLETAEKDKTTRQLKSNASILARRKATARSSSSSSSFWMPTFRLIILVLATLIGLGMVMVTQEQMQLLANVMEDGKAALYQTLLPPDDYNPEINREIQYTDQLDACCQANRTTLQPRRIPPPRPWPSFCAPGPDLDRCTHTKLSYNLCVWGDVSNILLEDLLNLYYYKPERICNCRYPKVLLGGLLDYTPQHIQAEPCREDFLYYGYHHVSRIHHQVPNRVRLSKFTEPELDELMQYIQRVVVPTKCPHHMRIHSAGAPFTNLTRSRILYLNRNAQRSGRHLPPEAIVPKDANQLVVDLSRQSVLELLCTVMQYDLVVAPMAPELVLPMVLHKPLIALTNNYTTDYYFWERLGQAGVPFATLFMDNEPFVGRPNHMYFNNYRPTVTQIQQLRQLVDGSHPQAYMQVPFLPKGVKIKGSMTDLVRQSRRNYLAQQKNKAQ